MRKFVAKILEDKINDIYTYKIVSAYNEYSCREVCRNEEILFVYEVDPSIYHWDSYEIGLLYAWIDQEKGFLPLDHREVISEYLANNGEIRKELILKYAHIFNDSMDDIFIFKQYNKCIDLLNNLPKMRKNKKEIENDNYL